MLPHIYCINCVTVVVSKLDLCCLFPLCLHHSLLRISTGVSQFSADTKLNKIMTQPKDFQKRFIQTAVQLMERQVTDLFLDLNLDRLLYFILFNSLYPCLDLTTSFTK